MIAASHESFVLALFGFSVNCGSASLRYISEHCHRASDRRFCSRHRMVRGEAEADHDGCRQRCIGRMRRSLMAPDLPIVTTAVALPFVAAVLSPLLYRVLGERTGYAGPSSRRPVSDCWRQRSIVTARSGRHGSPALDVGSSSPSMGGGSSSHSSPAASASSCSSTRRRTCTARGG